MNETDKINTLIDEISNLRNEINQNQDEIIRKNNRIDEIIKELVFVHNIDPFSA